MKTNSAFILAIALGLFTPLLPLRAQTFVAGAPKFVDFQGTVYKNDGAPYGSTGTGTGPYASAPENKTMQFRIYDGPSPSATLLWAESQTVTVNLGSFAVRLGSGAAIGTTPSGAAVADIFAKTKSPYLELTVVTGTTAIPILPRLAFQSSPFAFVAQRARKADEVISGGSLSGTISATGSTITGGTYTQGTFSGNGSQLTGLTASQIPDLSAAKITSGILPIPLGGTGSSSKNFVDLTTDQSNIGGNKTFTGATKFTPGTAGMTVEFPGWVGSGAHAGTQIAMMLRSNNNGPQLRFQNTDTTSAPITTSFFDIGQNASGGFVIEGGNTDVARLTIDKDGKVGIGTTSPASKLVIANKGVSTVDLQFRSDDGTLNDTDFPVGRIRAGWDAGKTSYSDSFLKFENATGDNAFSTTMTLKNGNVGIGMPTSTTLAKLVVNGSVSAYYRGDSSVTSGSGPTTEGSSDYYGANGSATLGTGFEIPLSIWASKSIMGTSFIAKSDKRIKDVVGPSDSRADLELINRLRVTDYRMKDRLVDGSGIHKGLIAQEVEAIIPEAVSRTLGFIPDIYKAAVKTTFDADQKTLTLEMTEPHKLAVGDKIQIYADMETLESEVIAVATPTTFSVEASSSADRAFVYGRQVDDFRAVNYDRIFITAVGALQQMKKDQDAQIRVRDEKIAALEQRLAVLEEQVKRVADLEAKDQARDAKLAAIEKLLSAPDQAALRTISLQAADVAQ